VPDFPSPGILFKDITPMLRDARGFAEAVKYFSQVSNTYDLIAGVEARGFIFASAVAQLTGKGFVPIRKSGKLPAAAYSQSYALEYGEATLQIHQDAVNAGERVLLIDDVLATGGTLAAASALIAQCGAIVDTVAVLMEIDGLGGRAKYASAGHQASITVLL
jgi:adenine phosphoribosyltransferase